MAVVISKKIPSSNFYTGSGDTSITLAGVTKITVNTKKSSIKITYPQSPNRQNSNQNDIPINKVLDLKRVDDIIKISGWLEDDKDETAWNKAWKLRAMCVSGNIDGDKGALDLLKIDNIEFKSSTVQAFLENVSFEVEPQGIFDSLDTNINYPSNQTREGRARVRVDLDFYLGTPR